MGHSTVRLHIDHPLSAGTTVAADTGQIHYLRSVMRLGPGSEVLLFNGRDGEWSAEIERLDRHAATLRITRLRRPPIPEPDIWLAFAPIKAARIDYLAQKATELGIARLMPVMTERTQMTRVNTRRLRANAVEAAEQSGRLSVPVVDPPISLAELLADWPAQRLLLAVVARGPAIAIAGAVAGLAPPLGLLIGPEGGFAPTELDALTRRPNVKAVSLGPRVLRAETAAIAALSVVQALAGDWRLPRPD